MSEWDTPVGNESGPMWIIADEFKNEGTTFEIKDLKEHESASGKKVPIMVIEGEHDDYRGNFNISKWSLKFSKPFLEEHGKEPQKFIGKRCQFKRQGKKLLVLPDSYKGDETVR